jgi:hypothetical protein
MRLLDQIRDLSFPTPLPPTLLRVAQHFDASQVVDVAGAAIEALRESGALHRIAPGATVAVTAGSRGIRDIALVIRAVVAELKRAGACPFVIAAMGSHAGATADGQLTMLAELGVTPDAIGADVRATMDVIEVGRIPGGPILYQDVISAAADHTVLVNRVKPHTDFRGELESGLAKMEVVGLGKQRGAMALHAYGAAGFRRFLAPAARIYEAHSNVIGGLAILENAYDRTAEIHGLAPNDIGGTREVELQARAKALMPSLPFPEIEVLTVRQIGKNISGTGMDTNIIGRLMIPRESETFGGPDVALICLLDLADESHGNASGIGLANVTTARLAQKVDWVPTYTNAATSAIFGMLRNALPITMADDRRALELAVRCCGRTAETARLVFIQDTLHLAEIWVSPSLQQDVEAHPQLARLGETPLVFDPSGCMTSPWAMT